MYLNIPCNTLSHMKLQDILFLIQMYIQDSIKVIELARLVSTCKEAIPCF